MVIAILWLVYIVQSPYVHILCRHSMVTLVVQLYMVIAMCDSQYITITRNLHILYYVESQYGDLGSTKFFIVWWSRCVTSAYIVQSPYS